MPAKSETQYCRFTPTMMVNIAAPHTWPAAIMPTLVAVCAAAGTGHQVSVLMAIICLAITILMQSSVNTFNDFYDYIKGTDSKEDDVDPTDAVLVYNNVNPRSALALAIVLLALAFLLGIAVIARVGFIPLIIALVGALFVVIYSAGKTPISYLPLGELTSGVVMGGLIPLATFQAVTGEFSWLALLWALPTIITVGLIMFTNNTCDIERDIPAGRRTLSVVLGRESARKLYHTLLVLAMLCIVIIDAGFFTNGLLLMPFMILAAFPSLKALFSNPLDASLRHQTMPQVLTVNIVLGAFYCASMLAAPMALVL